MKKYYILLNFATVFLSVVFVGNLEASSYYVDRINGTDNNSGTLASPWKTISKANSTLTAGDTVYIRGGEYGKDTIRPANAGSSDSPITYSRYQNEEVKFSGVSNAVFIDQPYITIDGFTFIFVNYAVNIRPTGTYAEVRNCTDSRGRGYGNFYISGNYAYIHDNTFRAMRKSTTQAEEISQLMLKSVSYVRVIDNEFIDGGGHSMFETEHADYNVIRGNIFYTTGLWTKSKDGKHPATDAMVTNIKASDYNIYEENTFYESGGNFGDSHLELIKVHNSRNIIIRKNIAHHFDLYFWGCYTSDVAKAPVLYNVIYNNTIYKASNTTDNQAPFNLGSTPSDGPGIQHISILNNIVDTSYRYGVFLPSGSGAGHHKDIVVKNNIFYNVSLSDGWWYGTHLSVNQDQAVSPGGGIFSGNDGVNPRLLNPENLNFTLQSTSPAISTGTWLATITTSADSGTHFTVDHPEFFYDGYGISAEKGDTIKTIDIDDPSMHGQVTTIKSVDYTTGTITVSKPISWNNGTTHLALNYAGTRPDMGAYAYTQSVSSIRPPLNLKILLNP